MNNSYYKKILFMFLVLGFFGVYVTQPKLINQLFIKARQVYQVLPAILFKQRFKLVEQELAPIDTKQETLPSESKSQSQVDNTKKSYVMPKYSNYSNITKENILAIINEERNKNKLRSLRFDNELGLSAQKKADEMLTKGYFSHETPDGKDFTYFIDYGGYDFMRVSENLARGEFSTSRDVVLAWMNSPTHKANIFDGIMVDTGIGIVFGKYKGVDQYMIVQHFGRPRGACPLIDRSLEPDIKILTARGKLMYAEIQKIQVNIDAILNNNPNATLRDSAKTMEKDLQAKISEYNNIVDTLQERTLEYNTQAKAFNACNTNYYTP